MNWEQVVELFNNLLPVHLLGQLVEHCTGITEVKGLNPVQPWFFFVSALELSVMQYIMN